VVSASHLEKGLIYSCANKASSTTLLLNGAARTGMNHQLPVIYIARHGETAWTITEQHTGLTDLPLTPQGENNARRLGERLKGIVFDAVFTSPLQRARKTCALAGFGPVAQVDSDLVEWNYGEYEGRRTDDIRQERPGWVLFRDGAPGGESPAQVAARADNVCTRLRNAQGNVLLFSSGHFIRVLAARWIGLEPSVHSTCFLLSTASLSAVGYDHDPSRPVIRFWNDTHHTNNA
jgi:probable phosphoglycerate mutase